MITLPYPGLRPFEEADGPIFFGRQAQIASLLRRLEKNRFVAVIGSSGSGKSSLVRAGLLPAIRAGFLFAKAKWLSVTVRPGREPYKRLADELLNLRPQFGPTSGSADFDISFRKTLRLTDAGLVKALSTLGLDPETHFLIVVDQFEELFSFRSDISNQHDCIPRDEASAFVNTLLDAFQDKNARVWVLLTMRSDFIGSCEAFLTLPENVSKSQFLVPRLDSRQMEDAIVRPGLVNGVAFKPFTVPRELANLIINEAGDQPDQLPLMQHALMRTWKNAVARTGWNDSRILTEGDYEAAGRIKNALSQDARAAWLLIKQDRQLREICRRTFMLLCDVLPDGRLVRRRPTLAEVRKITGASEQQIDKLLAVFQQDDRNLLLPYLNGTFDEGCVLDIAHEALLRRWDKIRRWIQRETESVANYRELLAGVEKRRRDTPSYRLNRLDTQRLDAWEQQERPTQMWAQRYGGDFNAAIEFLDLCRKNRRRRFIALLAVTSLTVLSLSYFVYLLHLKNSQLNRTNGQLNERVLKQQRELELQRDQSQHLLNDANTSLQKRSLVSHINALRLTARSLRVFRGNADSQRLLCQLLMENRWCLPITATLTCDIDRDKYILAAALLPDHKTLAVVTQEGTVLKWDGHMLHRWELPTQIVANEQDTGKEAQPKSILPKLGEAFFSDDGTYLITIPTRLPTVQGSTVKMDCQAEVYYDKEGTGTYRYLQPIPIPESIAAFHNISWSPKNDFFVLSTIDWQKQVGMKSTLFENLATGLRPTGLLDNLEISAACFSSDGENLFFSIPGVKVTSPSQVDFNIRGRTTRIVRWNIRHDGARASISQDVSTTFDLGSDSKAVYLSCNADGTYVAASYWNLPVTVLDTRTKEVKSFYGPNGGQIFRAIFCPSKEKRISDLMMLATTDRVGFWRVSELTRIKANDYGLGAPWCEPIVFQGLAIPNFVDNGSKIVIVSDGCLRSYESARALELPIYEKCSAPNDNSFSVKDSAPDWLLDIACVLTGSGREPDSETEDRPRSIQDVYLHNTDARKTTNETYQSLWRKFRPAD